MGRTDVAKTIRPTTASHSPAPPDKHAHTMFGAFRFTNPLSGGLLWKIPWRLSKFQKYRQRKRLRAVDSVVATVDAALARTGETLAQLERWKAEMPTEAEMLAKDKYTMFDRKAKRYRKGIHKLPKWTRVSQRLNPPGY
ncbi:mitochondrial ribosomal protein L31-domain-containing protein [Podospora conica]|nr:mitochondrial ribosomal protein L31-domain-containing protein [Schizothecium conicum]